MVMVEMVVLWLIMYCEGRAACMREKKSGRGRARNAQKSNWSAVGSLSASTPSMHL